MRPAGTSLSASDQVCDEKEARSARGRKPDAGSSLTFGSRLQRPGDDRAKLQGIPETGQIHAEKDRITDLDRNRELDASPFESQIDESRVERDTALSG